jgi:hypothetical protein
LGQGLACRGDDESENSLNKEKICELLKWLSEIFVEVNKVVLKNAPKNAQMTSPKIQKDLINSYAKELGALLDDDGWKTFLEEVTTFCVKHDVEVPSMDDQYEPVIKSKRYRRKINNLHCFHVEIF